MRDACGWSLLIFTSLLLGLTSSVEEYFQCGYEKCVTATQACYPVENQCVDCSYICGDPTYDKFCEINCQPYLESLRTTTAIIPEPEPVQDNEQLKDQESKNSVYILSGSVSLLVLVCVIVLVVCLYKKIGSTKPCGNLERTNPPIPGSVNEPLTAASETAASEPTASELGVHAHSAPKPKAAAFTVVYLNERSPRKGSHQEVQGAVVSPASSLMSQEDITPPPAAEDAYQAQEPQRAPTSAITTGGRLLSHPEQEEEEEEGRQTLVDPDLPGPASMRPMNPVEAWANDLPPPTQQINLKEIDEIELEETITAERRTDGDRPSFLPLSSLNLTSNNRHHPVSPSVASTVVLDDERAVWRQSRQRHASQGEN